MGRNRDNSPKWSPDASKIVYKSNEDGEMKLYLMWMDTREKFVLLDTKESPRNIAWSSDGNFLVFTKFVPSKESSNIKLPEKPEGAKWNDAPKYITDMKYRGDGSGYLASGNDQKIPEFRKYSYIEQNLN